MSLPPINHKPRASVSLSHPKVIYYINHTSSNDSQLTSQIPIIKIDKKLKPELNITKIFSKQSKSIIEVSKSPSSRLTPLISSPSQLKQLKKSTYLKLNYLNSIKERQSDYLTDFTKPIRDYFTRKPPPHKSYFDCQLNKSNKKILIPEPDKPLSPKHLNTIPENPVREIPKPKKPNNRKPVQAKSSFKKKTIEEHLPLSINESLQTDWNSFTLEEWELDPEA